jgi:hypothetical protein
MVRMGFSLLLDDNAMDGAGQHRARGIARSRRASHAHAVFSRSHAGRAEFWADGARPAARLRETARRDHRA